MFELLMAAIRNGNTDAVISIMTTMPVRMLLALDFTGSSLIHYLARFDHKAALDVARTIMPPEKFTDRNDENFTPFITAVHYNHPAMVEYFEANKIDTFCSPLHRQAYYNTVQMPITDEEASRTDAGGYKPIC